MWRKALRHLVSKVTKSIPFRGHSIKSVRTLSQELRKFPVNSNPDRYHLREESSTSPFGIFNHVNHSGLQTEVKVIFGMLKPWNDHEEAMWLGLLVSVDNAAAASLRAVIDLHPYEAPTEAAPTEALAVEDRLSTQPVVLPAVTRKAHGPKTPVDKTSEKEGDAKLAAPDLLSGCGGDAGAKRTAEWTTLEKTTNEISLKASGADHCHNVKTGARLISKEDAKEKEGVDRRVPILLIVDPKTKPFVVLTALVETSQRLMTKITGLTRKKPSGDAEGAKLPCKTFGKNLDWAAMSIEEILNEIANC